MFRRALVLAVVLAHTPAQADRHDARDPDPPVHHLRIVLGQAAAILAGTAWYWIDRERQVADWDYPSILDRITLEAWRFDHNPFGINWIWHPIDGAGFHVIARANHANLPLAALYGFGTSMAWEYLLEFREKISINDVLVTPAAGVTIGEFFHWLGVYLDGGPSRGAAHDAARWILSPLHALDRELDGRGEPPRPASLDDLGLSDAIWHRFEVGYRLDAGALGGAADRGGGDPTIHGVALGGRLAAVRGYLQPVPVRRSFREGNVTRLDVRVATSGEGLGLAVHGDTMLVGRHLQAPTAAGGVRAVTYGLSLAYDYKRDRFGGFRDRLGLMHVPGPAIDGHVGGRRWMLSGSARAYLDFAGLHALAYDDYLEANPDTTEKEILRKQRYYYGWGGSTRVELDLSVPHARLGGALVAGRYRSIEGLDRNQEQIDDDVAARDTVIDAEAWLRLRPYGTAMIELRAARSRRASTVGAFDAEQSLTTVGVALGAEF